MTVPLVAQTDRERALVQQTMEQAGRGLADVLLDLMGGGFISEGTARAALLAVAAASWPRSAAHAVRVSQAQIALALLAGTHDPIGRA